MEVTRFDFQEKLPDILGAIEKSVFVAFDLEYSGIQRDLAPGVEKVEGRKQTIEERYQNVKYGASKYQVFQMGICTVEYDVESLTYITRPFNFYVRPIVKKGVGVIREFSVESDGLNFLVEHDFDFNKLFRTGVPFLSHAEDRLVRQRWAERESKVYDEVVKTEDSQIEFLASVRKEITAWLANSKRQFPVLNISNPNNQINAYQKMLVHQLVRAEFPTLSTSGKQDFIQISHKNPKKEQEEKDFKRSRFERETTEAAGLRLVVDQLIEKRKVLVGHNCFGDLAYLYRTFIDALPDTAEDFAVILRKDFQMYVIISLSTMVGVGYKVYSNLCRWSSQCRYPLSERHSYWRLSADTGIKVDRRSSLHDIYEDLHRQRMPEIDLHHLHRSYTFTNTSHVAGFDAWTTAKILIKLSVRLKVLGFDKNISLSEAEPLHKTDGPITNGAGTNSSIKINRSDKSNVPRKQPEENWSKLIDLERTPTKAVIPAWSDEFWQFFANKLRVFGTVDGVWEF